jgi:hypothetical protein
MHCLKKAIVFTSLHPAQPTLIPPLSLACTCVCPGACYAKWSVLESAHPVHIDGADADPLFDSMLVLPQVVRNQRMLPTCYHTVQLVAF